MNYEKYSIFYDFFYLGELKIIPAARKNNRMETIKQPLWDVNRDHNMIIVGIGDNRKLLFRGTRIILNNFPQKCPFFPKTCIFEN